MSSQPIIPYTAAEQIAALKRLAPELATKCHQLPAPHTVQALIALARSVERVAAEEGVPLRIVEVRSLPSPNPLATPLARERAARRRLQTNVQLGLMMAGSLLAVCAVLAYVDGSPEVAVGNATVALACLPLILMCRQALKVEVL